jgi:hypothetical protein
MYSIRLFAIWAGNDILAGCDTNLPATAFCISVCAALSSTLLLYTRLLLEDSSLGFTFLRRRPKVPAAFLFKFKPLVE